MRILAERDYRKETNSGTRRYYYWDKEFFQEVQQTWAEERISLKTTGIIQPKDCTETRMKKTEQRDPRNPEDSKDIDANVTGVLGVREWGKETEKKVVMDEIKQESLPGMSLISSIAVSTSFLYDVSLVLCPNSGVPVFPMRSKRLTISYVRPAHGSVWRKWASAPSLCSAAHSAHPSSFTLAPTVTLRLGLDSRSFSVAGVTILAKDPLLLVIL